MPALKPIKVVPKAWWRVHVDVLGPLEMSANGNQYVALGVCALLKYVEAARTNIIMIYSRCKSIFLKHDRG